MSGAKIGVSTHELALQTEKALEGKVPLELVLSVWHEIGIAIKQQLVQRKAVRLSGFGTFSFSVKGEPTFSLSTEFATQFKVKQRGQVTLDNVPTAALNCSSVGASLGTSRDVVEKIYAKFITCLGRMLYDGRDILLSFHRVAEIRMAQGELYCEFIPDFLASFGEPKSPTGADRFKKAAQKTSTLLNSAKLFEASIRRDRDAEQRRQNGLNIGGSDAASQRQGVRAARPSSAGRGRNPILGTGPDSPRSVRPNPANRPSSAPRGDFRGRPSSAQSVSTNTSRLTPRSQGEASYGFQGRPSQGGLTREALERHSQTQRGGQAIDRAARLRDARDMRERAAGASHAANADARLIAAKALDSKAVISKVRAKIAERGGSNGMRSIAKLLAIMDANGDKRLSKDELKYGLRDFGIDLTPTELEQVFLYFDRDRNGFVDITEFLVGIRGEMNERRRKMVRMAFDILDRDRSGVIDVDEILQAYDLRWHPEVRAGKMTVQEAARDFMKQWDRLEQDSKVTVEEFEDYYKELSASIDDDDYFELMIRNAWRIAGGQGAAANTANRRVLVTNKDGSQSIQTIDQELGMRGRDMEDVRGRLARQGVHAENVEMYGGVEDMRAAKAGRGVPVSNRARGGGAGASTPFAARPVDRAGRGAVAGRPREAWLDGPPNPGDQSLAPESYDYPPRPSPRDRRRGGAGERDANHERAGNRSAGSGAFQPEEALRKILYTPPVSLEALCMKLQVSAVESSPRIAQGAFTNRLSTLDPSLDRAQLAAMWKLIDPKNLGTVEVSTLHSFLGDRFGKDKTTQRTTSVIDRVIKKILERCGENAGIKGLQRTLAIMDNSGDKRLSKDELKYGLQDYGIELNLRELDDLFTYFDRDRNGTVDINELLIGIRGDLNERRARLVRMAFNLLDKDRSGVVSTEEMMESYNFKAHPDVVSGKKTVQEAAREFIGHWDRQNSDGVITYEEFEDYYKELSASIDGDDYFELMIRNAWRIAGGQGAAANTANRRVLVTNKDGSQSIQTIDQELGMRGRDMEDVRGRLARQGVHAENVEMYGGVESMRAAKTMRGPARNGPGGPSDRNQRPRSLAATAPAAVAAAPASQFARHAAAMKLAAAYRGRLGRKKAEHERRKADAEQRQYWEEQQEAQRPKPREIMRPKGKSYIGF